MRVSVKLKVSAEAFFNLLIDHVSEEIFQATNQLVARENLCTGLSYIKGTGHSKVPIKTEITSLVKNELYEVRIIQGNHTLDIRYQIEEISENVIRVVLSQYASPEKYQSIFTLIEGQLMAKMRLRDMENRIRDKNK